MRKERHNRREADGRYAAGFLCDCCGKPAGTNPLVDYDVCGDSDGPGFFLCERKRCNAVREARTIEERRALYTAQRIKNYFAPGDHARIILVAT